MEGSNPLDLNGLNVEEYYKSYIKTKSIDELINQDNKVFAEIKELETEKHYLVTQNYKKFVAATETINYIKSSLLGFENNINNLKDRINTIVTNFNVINSSVEDKLKSVNETYKIKRDLKRLKFINDLPEILQMKLDEYNQKKDLKILEKSLAYYEQCKDFLLLHRENALVKGIYIRTQQLILIYRHILDEEIQPEVNESCLKNVEYCLKLQVKIEEDKKDLISKFLSIYKHILLKKYDEIFAMKESSSEIDFNTYLKIYDSFEFGINENEFLFYEKEIKEMVISKEVKDKDIKFANLNSKKLKKGTLIWIVNKISETVMIHISQIHLSFIELFGQDTLELNKFYEIIIETFFNKFNNYISSTKDIDSVFFKESLLCFQRSFCDQLQKINDNKITHKILVDFIFANNTSMTSIYLNFIFTRFIEKVSLKFNEAFTEINNDIEFNKSKYFTSANVLYKKLFEDFVDLILIIKLLDFTEILQYSQSRANESLLKYFYVALDLFCFICYSSNNLRFEYHLLQIKENITKENFKSMKQMLLEKPENHFPKESIYMKICLNKAFTSNTKELIERSTKVLPILRSLNKNNEIEKNMRQRFMDNMFILLDSLIQFQDKSIYSKLKELFFDVDWNNFSEPITYRLEIKELCLTLLSFKNEVEQLLEEEKKGHDERKGSIISDSLLSKNKSKNVSKIKKTMELLIVRKLSIYEYNTSSPQEILTGIAKLLLKTINEFLKLKRVSKFGFQQIQIEMSFIKHFLKDYLIKDDQSVLFSFFYEILQSAGSNLQSSDHFDESLIQAMIEAFNKEMRG